MARQESQRVAELKTLRAELVEQLDRLDLRTESIGPALTAPSRPSSQRAQLAVRAAAG